MNPRQVDELHPDEYEAMVQAAIREQREQRGQERKAAEEGPLVANPQVIVELVADTTKLVDGMKGVEQSAGRAPRRSARSTGRRSPGLPPGRRPSGPRCPTSRAPQGTAELAKSTMMCSAPPAWAPRRRARGSRRSRCATSRRRRSRRCWCGVEQHAGLGHQGLRREHDADRPSATFATQKGNVNAVLMQADRRRDEEPAGRAGRRRSCSAGRASKALLFRARRGSASAALAEKSGHRRRDEDDRRRGRAGQKAARAEARPDRGVELNRPGAARRRWSCTGRCSTWCRRCCRSRRTPP